ncbi:hypothetical protein SAMN05421504_102118 [Amycolatopsis xylanica]|uniref:Molecular chaperone Hsp90 n=1 Tax=Amycolatopsis xylanica TaxID=589385 RepID=A0A1H2YGZ4_9PSEU|nr:ATP-binding protein [Amycolatopsis xylanica]SDX03904.1 hypothetical protein SAMN05421504_102118 [Amycolatopsis xylanica]
MATLDPFGTEALRSSVLRAWADSPTRFTEDTNSEHDLRVGGYRDRLFVELAQNAADAALLAKEPGVLRVSLVDNELRVANTGAPLDASGVASLASLRASAKGEGTVGRFGVGFAAVLTVTSEPRVVSAGGGVRFSEALTREESGRTGDVPVLRLPWAFESVVPQGFDTEVQLPLRDGVDGASLLEGIASEAPDLLLALPWLARIEVGDEAWTRSSAEDDIVEIGSPDGSVRRWLTEGGWAVPVDADGVPQPLTEDVLYAPTPTDERLSLPARLLASVPIEPSRRRVLPGARAVFEAAAGVYPALVRKLPAEHRLALVPAGGFPLSEVDGQLRELVIAALRSSEWLPSAAGPELSGSRARVLDAEAPELVSLLVEVVPGLCALSGLPVVRALAVVGSDPLPVAEIVDLLTGVTREPSWWRSVYDALLPLLESHEVTVDDLGALPVPLSDGRTLPGPRGALLVGGSAELLELLSDVDIAGLRLVHPEAAHPLLERLDAKHAEARELLDAPELLEAVERSVEDANAGLDGMALAGAVLRLVAETSADIDWLGALALPCDDGWRRADELVLPTSPLLEIFDPEVFAEDGPVSVLDDDFASDWPAETLSAAGVLDTFAVISDADPVEPDHDLPDEEAWWDSLAKPPARVLALRDLDLVGDDAWPAALRLIASRPETWRALMEPDGHTAWWLARYALLGDEPPRHWRLASASSLAGLYDPVPDVGLPAELLAAAGVRAALGGDEEDLLDRLGDPSRTIPAGLVVHAHGALTGEHEPARMRAMDGSVVDAFDAVVLDVPWPVAVVPRSRLIGVVDDPAGFAARLDLAVASDLAAEVTSEGDFVLWADLEAVTLAAELLGVPVPDGGLLLHESLTVSFDGASHDAPWWNDSRLHAADTPEGLAKAFAWATGRWADRHVVLALINEPDATTLLA